MKHKHLQTAVKALKRARTKYEIDLERFEVAEKSARESKELMAAEIEKLNKQIKEIEGEPVEQLAFT
jgi:coenzyme F420-reducing hydrogenase delta subunit